MAAMILVHPDYPMIAEILADSVGMNKIFKTWQDAESWLESNAEIGVAYRVFECDD